MSPTTSRALARRIEAHENAAARAQRAADAFNARQADLAQTVSDERLDEIENGTNKTPFKAYEYSALIARQWRCKNESEAQS
jgi:hypothetical protein